MMKKRAYELRQKTRDSWRSIGATIGVSKEEARRYAFDWARAHGLPQPPPRITNGEMAYEDRAAGASWDEIRYTLRMATANHARNAASNFALYHGLPWPPMEATNEPA